MTVQEKLAAFKPQLEIYLKGCLKNSQPEFEAVYSAMQYSLLLGGKRLRPFILQQFYFLNGGQGDGYFPFAAALEMIHTYSLIHDDLPCMDNDLLRRGKPSCHAKFGESTALLAGDALLTLAFQTAAGCQLAADRVLKATGLLAECAGAGGMIGGQVLDLAGESDPLDLPAVQLMYREKTSALLRAAAGIGTVLAGGNAGALKAAFDFANALGLAFQIQDDLLDLKGDEKTLGKPVGSDEKNHKNTYVSLCGVEKAEQDALAYTKAAQTALNEFGPAALTLQQLADWLTARQN